MCGNGGGGMGGGGGEKRFVGGGEKGVVGGGCVAMGWKALLVGAATNGYDMVGAKCWVGVEEWV